MHQLKDRPNLINLKISETSARKPEPSRTVTDSGQCRYLVAKEVYLEA